MGLLAKLGFPLQIQVQLIQTATKAALVHNTIKDTGNDDN